MTQVVAVTVDTAALIAAEQMRSDGKDARIVYHDGATWQELPRHLENLDSDATTISFPLQAPVDDTATGP